MRIVIAGCGKVGTALAEQLCREKHDIVVIDSDEERLNYLTNNEDVLCLCGDAKSVEMLESAGVEDSDLLLAMTGDDEENLLICLLANKMGVTNTIARVRNPLYLHSIDMVKEDLGLSLTINPDLEAAAEMFKTLRFKSAVQVETFAKGQTEILTCVVKENTPICNIQIKDVYNAIHTRILVCAIKREEKVFIPNGNTRIQAGDTLSFVASTEDVNQFFKKMNYDTGRITNLTIIGGGKIGYYLGKMAMESGIPLKIIDQDQTRCRFLKNQLSKADVICGDAMSTKLLAEESVLKASAVACLTSDDATNTLIGMYISRNAPETKVISKIKRSDFEDMLFNLGYGSVYNSKYIAADTVIRYVRAMGNAEKREFQSLSHIIDNKVEVLEFLIQEDSQHVGEQLQYIKFRKDLLVANIQRGTQTFTPNGSDTLEPGDSILVVTTISGISKFEELFA